MSQREIKVNICLSKRFRPGAYEILQTAFTNSREDGLTAHKFDLKLFRKNCQKYMQDDALCNHLTQALKEQSVQAKEDSKALSAQELESYVDNISQSTNDIENNSKYLKLEQALHNYLYVPEEGKALLQEYQSTIASREQVGKEFKVSFNDFLRDKLINIKNFDDLKDYPQLYNDVITHGEYKNVRAMASALKNVSIVADIHHAPQELTDGTEVVVNESENTRLLNFRTQHIEQDYAIKIQKGTDYNPGAEEDRAELFNGGNFCGSSFRNINFDCDLDEVNFQNCTLKHLLFSGDKLNNINVCGIKTELVAIDARSINGIKIDVYDPRTLELIGIAKFDLSQRSLDTALEIDNSVDMDEPIVDDIRQCIKRFEDLRQRANDLLQSNEQGGWDFFGWPGSIIKNTISAVTQLIPTNLLQNNLSEEQLRISISNLNKEMDGTIENVRQKYGQTSQDYIDLSNEYNQLIVEYDSIKRNHRYQANLNKAPIKVTNMTTDSTYRPSEAGKNIVKIYIKVNRSDMEEFATSNEAGLSEFSQNKYHAKVNDIIRTKQSNGELNDTAIIMVIPDASGEDLSGINLHGKNISSTILAGCNLSEINLSNATVVGTCFEGSNLTNATLCGSKICDVNMNVIHAPGAKFDNSKLTNVTLQGANMGALVPGGNSGNECIPASFKNAILIDVNMRNCNINGCDISSAKVEKSDFDYSNMAFVNANNIKVQGSTLYGVNAYKGNFPSCKIEDSSMEKGILAYANLNRSKLVNVKLNDADARGVTLQGAYMPGVEAPNSDFEQANFENANVAGANFEGANLTGVNAENADFSRTNLKGADARNGKFNNTNMDGVESNKYTQTLGATMENAKNLPTDLAQRHKDQQDMTSRVKRMFYSVSNRIFNQMLTFAQAYIIPDYVYTAGLSAIVALSLPVILTTSVAAFIAPPVGVVLTVIGTVALTVATAQQIIYHSAVYNPIAKVIDQVTKIKNKIFSSNLNLAKNSTNISKDNDALSNTVPSQTITKPKAQSRNTSKLQSNTETKVQNNDIDKTKPNSKMTREDSKLQRRSSTPNRANHSTIKKSVADNTSKVTTNDVNNNHIKNQQPNKKDQANKLLPNVKKLPDNIKLDKSKNKAPRNSMRIVNRKGSSSRTP